jgi:hypothetical protein
MKIKTAELTGAALDWAVNQIEECCDDPHTPLFSTNWAQGGPIIEQEKITLEWTGENWCAYIRHDAEEFGLTPLIAAMRCYVSSKLGDEVDISAELFEEQ